MIETCFDTVEKTYKKITDAMIAKTKEVMKLPLVIQKVDQKEQEENLQNQKKKEPTKKKKSKN